VRLLDTEQWKQAEVCERCGGRTYPSCHGFVCIVSLLQVPSEVQFIVDAISGSSLNGKSSVTSSSNGSSTAGSWISTSKELAVHGQHFKVVGSCLMLVKMLGDYVALARGAPVVAVDAANRSIELLRSFNSRTTQLILKAGAMKVAGLKMISSKHLGERVHVWRSYVLWKCVRYSSRVRNQRCAVNVWLRFGVRSAYYGMPIRRCSRHNTMPSFSRNSTKSPK
jgi:hypothetical protein